MFADSLLDSAWEHSSRRRWTTAASFTLQALGIGILLLVPVIYTQGLPQLSRQVFVTPMPDSQGPPPTNAPQTDRAPISNYRAGILRIPTRIPSIPLRVDDRGIPPVDPGLPTVPAGGTGTGADPTVVWRSILDQTAHVVIPPKPFVRPSPRASVMMEGHLVHRVEPIYPPVPRQAGIQGQVVLQAIISKEGTIENLRVLSGHPLLVPAAVDAVRQWRYRPYTLNGDPVEVETHVTVNFVLSRG
jgi:periplasmic protein TonB